MKDLSWIVPAMKNEEKIRKVHYLEFKSNPYFLCIYNQTGLCTNRPCAFFRGHHFIKLTNTEFHISISLPSLSFIQYLLSTKSEPGTVLGSRAKEMNKSGPVQWLQCLCPHNVWDCWLQFYCAQFLLPCLSHLNWWFHTHILFGSQHGVILAHWYLGLPHSIHPLHLLNQQSPTFVAPWINAPMRI